MTSQRCGKIYDPVRHTCALVRAPAAKILVQIERRGAISPLNIRQPLRHDIQKRRVQPDARSYAVM